MPWIKIQLKCLHFSEWCAIYSPNHELDISFENKTLPMFIIHKIRRCFRLLYFFFSMNISYFKSFFIKIVGNLQFSNENHKCKCNSNSAGGTSNRLKYSVCVLCETVLLARLSFGWCARAMSVQSVNYDVTKIDAHQHY